MDPDAALDRLIEAATVGDDEELREAAEDLADWIESGGFAPLDPRKVLAS